MPYVYGVESAAEDADLFPDCQRESPEIASVCHVFYSRLAGIGQDRENGATVNRTHGIMEKIFSAPVPHCSFTRHES
jgi:hypothetical protein